MGAATRLLVRRIALFLVLALVSCPLALSWAEYESAPVVSIKDIHDKPDLYDSTFMRNLVAITGTIVDMDATGFDIKNGEDTIRVEGVAVNQTLGFEKGDEVKVVGYYFKPRRTSEYIEPVYLLRYPERHVSASVEDITEHPERYNGMVVSISGRLTKLERSSEFIHVLMLDDNPNLRIRYSGLTVLKEGMLVSVKGLVNYRTLYADEVKEITVFSRMLTYMQYLLGGLAAMLVVYLLMRRI
ncbi:MAG: hypothetical protein ACXQS1_02925 [Methermicoccaceae archaeon]